MARPKGSKNIPKDPAIIPEDQTTVDPILFDEDLLHPEPKPKILLGYHPITGVEVWQ